MGLFKILAPCTPALAAAPEFQQEDIITRDGCILRGGATGSYAAMQLVERGHSMAVLDDLRRMGDAGTYLINKKPEYVAFDSRWPASIMAPQKMCVMVSIGSSTHFRTAQHILHRICFLYGLHSSAPHII